MKNLYMVNFNLEIVEYMNDPEQENNRWQGVWAESEVDAIDDLRKHWEDRSSEYGTYYYVNIIEVYPTVGTPE